MGTDDHESIGRSEIVYERSLSGDVVAAVLRDGTEVARASGRDKRQALLNLIEAVARKTNAEVQ